MVILVALASTAISGLSASSLPGDDWLARGDAAFAERAVGSPGPGLAAAASIDPAIEAYEKALAQHPESLERRIRLLRAIFYKGEYVPADTDERRVLFEHGREIFEQGFDRLDQRYDVRRSVERGRYAEAASRLEGEPLAGPLFFWGSVHWGLWGQYFGKMASIRRGVAKKIRMLGEMALELDADIDQAGPYRLLGRMHAIAPRVPLFTLWIDREVGVDLLEKAVARAPRDPLNRFFLAEALLEHRPEESERALAMLCALEQEQPRDERVVEDQKALAQARERLEDERTQLSRRGRPEPCSPATSR